MSTPMLDKLQAIVGKKGLTIETDAMSPFLKERRGLFIGSCLAVVRPANTKEVAEVVACCKKYNIAITPQSGNTGLCGGAVPDGGIILNLSRMNTIREIDTLNGTMTVEAGCILGDLQNMASSKGMLLSLNCPARKECQIGGNISTNLGGTNVLRYGNTRDVVLGLEVVLPSGEIWDGLRGLRKDNAGYDLKHLYIGAEGTLGVITAATIRLYPQPKKRQTAMVAGESAAQVMDVFSRVRGQFSENLVGFEIISRNAIEVVLQYDNEASDPFTTVHNWYGLIELNSTDDQIELEGPLENLLAKSGCSSIVAESEEESAVLWNLREQISAAQKVKGASIKHDVSVPLSSLADFIEEGTRLVEEKIPGVIVCSFGHAGDGNVHFNVTQPQGMEPQDFLNLWGDVNRIVHDLVDQLRGSVAAEHGVGRLKIDEMSRYKSSVEMELMRQIKKALDPQNICNPGKVIRYT